MGSYRVLIDLPDRSWSVRFEQLSPSAFPEVLDLVAVFRATAENGSRHHSFWGIDSEFSAAALEVLDSFPSDPDGRSRFYLRGIVRLYRRTIDSVLSRPDYRRVIGFGADDTVQLFTGPRGGTHLEQLEGEIEDRLFDLGPLVSDLTEADYNERVPIYLNEAAAWDVAEPQLRDSSDPAIRAAYQALDEFHTAYEKIAGFASRSDESLPRFLRSCRRANSLGHLALRKIAGAKEQPVSRSPDEDSWPSDTGRAWWLREVRLERFKAALTPEPIPLQPFTVLIGRNGSGKSTLLEALQWLDTAIRRDIREATDRYYGISNLIHRGGQEATSYFKDPYFQLGLDWCEQRAEDHRLRYDLWIEAQAAVGGLPIIARETLEQHAPNGGQDATYRIIETRPDGARLIRLRRGSSPSVDHFVPSPEIPVLRNMRGPRHEVDLVAEFWLRAVFLRLSPSRLAQASPATRKSFDPLLDEEGHNLPALLAELDEEQRVQLIHDLQDILVLDLEDLSVSSLDLGQRIFYRLHERIAVPDQPTRITAEIPAWMLSEGTRRLTAILALLVREPPPSLLCIEEIENGLDPWTARAVLQHLQGAVDRGTQVIITTHSPWVLDEVPMDSILQVRRIDDQPRYERFASRPEVKAYAASVPAGTRYVNEAE